MNRIKDQRLHKATNLSVTYDFIYVCLTTNLHLTTPPPLQTYEKHILKRNGTHLLHVKNNMQSYDKGDFYEGYGRSFEPWVFNVKKCPELFVPVKKALIYHHICIWAG